MSDLKSYQLVYPDPREQESEPSGGYVEIHITHRSHEAPKNVETATFLARLGYQVRLLPIDTSFRSPDAYLVKEQIRIEFKHNQTPTAGAIDNELLDAHRQADYVLIHIQSNIRPNDLVKAITNRMRAAQNIKQLWLIWRGELIRLKRKEIFGGTVARKIQ